MSKIEGKGALKDYYFLNFMGEVRQKRRERGGTYTSSISWAE